MSFLLFTGVIIILLIQFVFKKWKCNNGTCEKVLGGDYSSLKDCKESSECNNSLLSEKINTKPTPIPVKHTPPYGYDCINNNCEWSPGGLYSTHIDCKNKCLNIPDYSYGYDLRLLPLNRSPYIHKPRRRHRKRS